MSAGRWWVEAQGRAWGPYPAERLSRFRDEGRLGPASRVATAPDGPFAPAHEALPALFAQPGAEEAPPAAPVEPEIAEPGARTLLVFTDAPEAELAVFETALAGYGDAVRVGPGLWLVRTREGAGPLRNSLSRRLRAPAMLLVAEAPLTGAAWFNLEGDTDRALRRLWSATQGG